MIKKVTYLVFILLVIYSCQEAKTTDKQEAAAEPSERLNGALNDPDTLQLQNLFSLRDAEKILGEPAHVKDSTLSVSAELSIYNCSYLANALDPQTGKTGSVYVMIEQYQKLDPAKQTYNAIKKANESHEGIKVLEDLGDEAYFHSDGENFFFILARKGEKVLRMKVNKITSHTSLNEFNAVARNIVDRL